MAQLLMSPLKIVSQIYIQDIYTGQRQLVTSHPGINGAPQFSPDGTKLAMVLSKDRTGATELYLYDLQTKRSAA